MQCSFSPGQPVQSPPQQSLWQTALMQAKPAAQSLTPNASSAARAGAGGKAGWSDAAIRVGYGDAGGVIGRAPRACLVIAGAALRAERGAVRRRRGSAAAVEDDLDDVRPASTPPLLPPCRLWPSYTRRQSAAPTIQLKLSHDVKAIWCVGVAQVHVAADARIR